MGLLQLSCDDARRMTLRAQLLLGVPNRRAGVVEMMNSLGAVQLDTISVLARSHELIAYARLGAIGRANVERAYWGGDETFEYWGHAASLLPRSAWPLFAFRRRHFRAKHGVWSQHHAPTAEKILARIRAEGPLTASDLGGAKESTQWWGWSQVKQAAEYLLAAGELVCVTRVGWKRLYDLPERHLPTHLLHDDLDDDACKVALIKRSGAALAVATATDIADYFRLQTRDVVRLLPQTDLVQVEVEGWQVPAWASRPAVADSPSRARHRTTLLSPFDSLVWDRKRTQRVFGFVHRLEAYVPKAKREHGYFTMPVLSGGRLIARVDPARKNGVLIARQVSVEPSFATNARIGASAAMIATALKDAASWVGCTGVDVDRAAPAQLRQLVRAAL